MLARRLWEHSQTQLAEQRTGLVEVQPSEGTSWISQVRREISSLQRSSPGSQAHLETTIRGALRLARTTAVHHGITLEEGQIQPGLRVRFHPSALRQVLLTTLAEVEQSMSSGTITVSAEHNGDYARITITASPARVQEPLDISLARELLSAQGGFVGCSLDGDKLSLALELPVVERPERKVTVLAIDDNSDLIALYKSYCIGTMYEIIHVWEGKRAFQAIQSHSPDIILLDVMLPDVDGWDLLLDLHANPATRDIPIVVCSVITDEELALTLGAAAYLRKPVWRQQLVEALDQVLSLGTTEASKK